MNDLLRHGGRKQHGLPLGGHLLQNTLDLRRKAHIEHAIGLVQHQRIYAIQPHRALLQMVNQSSGRGHNDVRVTLDGLLLHVHGGTANQDRCAQLYGAPHLLKRLFHLQRQLARGQQDKPAPLGRRESLDHGQSKRQCLPRPRLRDTDHILSFHGNGDGALLNGRGIFKPKPLDDSQQVGRQTKAKKALVP